MHRRGTFEDVPLPDLVILDLKPGDEAGFDLLRSRTKHPLWRFSPVIVLVTEDDATRRCYEAGANACITKPDGLDELAHLMTHINNHWFNMVSLPPSESRLKELDQHPPPSGW